jgi:hypothetical protein
MKKVLAALAELPLHFRAALFAIALLHAVGLSWGVPSSDAWDVDGIAPRDFLPGLAATYTPGDFYTYPPLQLAILAVLTAPVTIAAVLSAKSHAIADVVRHIIEPSYMTAMTVTARFVTLVMSLGIVVALALATAEVVPEERKKRTMTGVAVAIGVGFPFTYYSNATNLDIPYNFWASLAVLGSVRAIARREPRRFRSALPAAALAVATKDQAYALFVLGLPFAALVFAAVDPWARTNLRRLAKELAIGGAIALAVLLAIDGALTNPSGFRARLAFLGGPASQDFVTYSSDLRGRLQLLSDLVTAYGHVHYHPAFALLPVVGFAFALSSARGARLAAALVPILLAISFSVCFNFVARRAEERFTLPQALLLSTYSGIALERLWAAAVFPLGARMGVLALLAPALFRCVELDANLVFDPRYDAEAWLRAHVRPADTIETYGLNVYLPRFPASTRVVRVGPSAPAKRGPVPGVEEVQAPFGEIEQRAPRFIVVSECFSWRYFPRPSNPTSGAIYPPTQYRTFAEGDGAAFFHDLFAGRLGYAHVTTTRFEHPPFRQVAIHASVSCPTAIFERRAGEAP